MFLTRIVVNWSEVKYLRAAVAQEMPWREGDSLSADRSMAAGKAELLIESVEPLSLAQRQFLVGCGFQFSTGAR